MRLTVIGSGDAFNASGALHSCYVVEHAGGTLMLECGPGVLAGMKRLSMNTDLPDAVLVSHLHGDHFGGLPFLFLEYTFQNVRTRPLVVAGPTTIEERVFRLYEALYQGMSQTRDVPFDLEFVALEPGSRFEVAGFRGEAFRVPHNAEPFSLAFRLEGVDATLVFSGDSGWTESFVEKTRDSDLFLCECCSIEPFMDMHLSYSELLAHRNELGCRRMLLTHLGEDVRADSRVEFDLAADGMRLEFRRG
jgi:ribonuclease BN (tRNA processing enzyme)